MTASPERLARIADELIMAETMRRAMPPITQTDPGFDVADAYGVQSIVWGRRLAAGRRGVGHKVGLTSQAMQQQLGVSEPDYGRLHDGMEVRQDASLDLTELIASRVEPEIAFILDRDLSGPGVTIDDVLAATRAVAPALEIIDSRISDWRISLADTVADNASSARFVVGDPRSPIGLDLAAVGVAMDIDDTRAGSGRGDAVLGHPAAAVAWLANTLAGLGDHLSAGDVVLPGAMCASVPLRAGISVVGRFEGLGEVRLRVAAA